MISTSNSSPPEAVEKPQLKIGFIPLTDCAPIVVAQEMGFFAHHGLEVELCREASWSSIRDKVACGLLDGAHMLAGIPIASTLGISGLHVPMVTAMGLDLNGNAITVSNDLYQRLRDADPQAMRRRPASAAPLHQVIAANRAAKRPPLTFATVFATSSHHYQLRYWLAAGGVDPDRDVRLIVIPPPQMVEQLEAGRIDGYCVGEPWNGLAVHRGLGHTLIACYDIWNNSPEKVFGVTRAWAEQHPRTHQAVLRALLEAATWTDQPEHRADVARLIARPLYVDAPPEVVRMSLTGSYRYGPDEPPVELPDFHVFQRYAATFPWRSHAIWYLTQMMRWGQLAQPVNFRRIAAEVYRPDLYRQAADEVGVAYPLANEKLEGVHADRWTLQLATDPLVMGPDMFVDGRVFDPGEPLEYLDSFDLRTVVIDSGALAAANL